MANITETLRRTSQTAPDAAALILSDGRVMSYRALDGVVDAIGAQLRRLGLQTGDLVALPRDQLSAADYAASLIIGLALARIGVASCNQLIPNLPIRAVLLPPGGVAPGSDLPVLTVQPGWFDPKPDTPACPMAPGGETVLALVGTSGTTGLRRLMALTHGMMRARMKVETIPGLAPGQRPVLMSGKASSSWLRTMFNIFELGGTIVLPEVSESAAFIHRFGVTTLYASVGWLQLLLPQLSGPRPASVRAVKVGGSALPPLLAEQAAARLCPNIHTGYGATEIGNIAIGRRAELQTAHGLGVGFVHSTVRLEVTDEHGSPLPPDTEGEIRVRAAGMVQGYLQAQPGDRSFRGGWFHPGDLGVLTKDRVLVLRGRVSQMIEADGAFIPQRRIEEVLQACPGVMEAAVFTAPNAQGQSLIWAALVGDGSVQLAELRRACEAKLGAAASPGGFLQLAHLPRNEAGKVAVAELTEMVRYRTKT